MTYIVTGIPRSGTSLMMHLLGKIGIPIFYSEEREKKLLKSNLENPYFYEDSKVMIGDFDYDAISGHAVKIFVGALLNKVQALNDNVKIIYMHRTNGGMQGLSGFLNPKMLARKKKMTESIKERKRLHPVSKLRLERAEKESDFFSKVQNQGQEEVLRMALGFLTKAHYLKYNLIMVDYDNLVDNPSQEIQRVKKFLDIDFNIEEVCAEVDKGLRHRKNERSFDLNI